MHEQGFTKSEIGRRRYAYYLLGRARGHLLCRVGQNSGAFANGHDACSCRVINSIIVFAWGFWLLPVRCMKDRHDESAVLCSYSSVYRSDT